ncbi:hypothetical protein [Actinomyces faecalis]|uniref:hypothetical protein n=1 Tax=Actinomyces faecalis TaxID=2722820 RepID=UPI0015534993|nr:hypothetical protein [Actinomyces faecalis]
MQPGPFVPAKSKIEAVARLYALAGVPGEGLGPGSKERKSVLTSVAARLDLGVDVTAAKDVLALQILTALGAPVAPSFTSSGQTITLSGLNALLAAAEAELRRRAEHELRAASPHLPDWFVPARDKLEAVRRISSLTGGRPQDLGPGSKERKSVFTDLVANLSLPIDTSLKKDDLAGAIARYLSMPWTDSCWSSGQTVTLDGLNAVLAGAEAITLRGRRGRHDMLLQEARLLVAALAHSCTSLWEGRSCVGQMLTAGYPKARQTEWIGWYYEFIGLPALINAYGGGPRRIGATEFDYARSFVWDLKAHAQPRMKRPQDVSGSAPLNDREAILTCVEETGSLGFLVLSGQAETDADGSFDTWHRAMRGSTTTRSATSRTLKKAFRPVTVDAYLFEGSEAVEEALGQRVLMGFRQGRQQSGAARRPKLLLNLERAQEEGYVAASQAPALRDRELSVPAGEQLPLATTHR